MFNAVKRRRSPSTLYFSISSRSCVSSSSLKSRVRLFSIFCGGQFCVVKRLSNNFHVISSFSSTRSSSVRSYGRLLSTFRGQHRLQMHATGIRHMCQMHQLRVSPSPVFATDGSLLVLQARPPLPSSRLRDMLAALTVSARMALAVVCPTP